MECFIKLVMKFRKLVICNQLEFLNYNVFLILEIGLIKANCVDLDEIMWHCIWNICKCNNLQISHCDKFSSFSFKSFITDGLHTIDCGYSVIGLYLHCLSIYR